MRQLEGICVDAIEFVLLCPVFLKRLFTQKFAAKPLPKDAKNPLSVDVRGLKRNYLL